MKIANLSDTHGLLRPEVVEHLKAADAILHGGDINQQAIVDELERYAPLYIVRGNNDKEWAEAIPHCLTFTLGGVTFFMVHNRKEVPADLTGVDVVVSAIPTSMYRKKRTAFSGSIPARAAHGASTRRSPL